MISTSTHASHLEKDSDSSEVHSVMDHGHIVRHATRSTERVGLGEQRTSGSRTKLDTGGVERLRPFRHISSGSHHAHF